MFVIVFLCVFIMFFFRGLIMFVVYSYVYLYYSCYDFSRGLIMFVLENALYLIMSQAIRCLKDPSLHSREKQLIKRELSAELVRYYKYHSFRSFGRFQIFN